jgi:hypothetical protein
VYLILAAVDYWKRCDVRIKEQDVERILRDVAQRPRDCRLSDARRAMRKMVARSCAIFQSTLITDSPNFSCNSLI